MEELEGSVCNHCIGLCCVTEKERDDQEEGVQDARVQDSGKTDTAVDL